MVHGTALIQVYQSVVEVLVTYQEQHGNSIIIIKQGVILANNSDSTN